MVKSILATGFSALLAPYCMGQLTVDPSCPFSWSENAGFINWNGAPPGHGVIIRDSYASGVVWGENVGWINLGDGSSGLSGSPLHYANAAGPDFGVNVDQTGALSGFAWSENAGWLNFGAGGGVIPAQPARVDLAHKRLRGYVWSENLGWINLDDAVVFVALALPCPADLNADGLVDDADFVLFSAAYNILDCSDSAMPPSCAADFNHDGLVDDADFVIFAAAYNDLLCP